MVTFEQIQHDPEIKTYIRTADESLAELGFTEHSFAHVNRTAELVGRLLEAADCSEREQELGKIAAYLHDIGNLVNRTGHAQSGALMAFQLLTSRKMAPGEVAQVVSAIGHHDEGTASAVNKQAAALILADKSDVRRSRVRNLDMASFDAHDRVNYAVTQSHLHFSKQNQEIVLDLSIDTEISPIIAYFEIFTERMILSTKAAVRLNKSFGLIINGQRLL